MIEVQNLHKWYGPIHALQGVSFHVERSTIVGFLGPNGAGKSTTLRILTGFLPPDSGHCRVAGHSLDGESLALRAAVGYLPERNPLYLDMRAEEYLRFRARMFAMDRAHARRRIDAVLDICQLTPRRQRLIRALSRGNRQRLGLAAALLPEPPVLILDEPSAGLDPTQATALRSTLAALREHHTVLISSHLLWEIEQIADKVILIAGGQIVADGTLEQLHRQHNPGQRVVLEAAASDPQILHNLLQGAFGQLTITGQRLDERWCRMHLDGPLHEDDRARIAALLNENRIALRELATRQSDLETLFNRLLTDHAQRHAPQP